MDASPAVSSRLIGAIFVERGLITEEQLQLALADQAASGERLGEILVQSYGVPRLELASALAEQWADLERPRPGEPQAPASEAERDADDLRAVSGEWTPTETQPRRPIGEIFLERGLVTATELDAALAEQQATGERLGEVLVSQGIVDRVDLASALADQWANLPKLRPPSADGETPRSTAASNAMVDELRDAVQELSGRLEAVAERIEAGAQPGTADDAVVGDLRSSLEEIKAWAEDERAIGRETRERLDEAVRRLEVAEGIAGRLDQVEQRLDQDATAAVLADTAATLRHDIDALAAAVQLIDGQTSSAAGTVREELDTFKHGLEARDEASARLAAELAGRLAAVESRPVQSDDPEASAGRDELRSALSELGSRLDERVGELHARIEAHAAEGFDTDATQAEANRLVAERVEQLAAVLEALAVDVSVGSTARDDLARSVHELLEARVGELNARLEAGTPGAELSDRVEQVAAAVDALQQTGGREEKLRKRLDRLAETVGELEQRGESTDAVRAELANELHATLDARLNELVGRVDGSETQLRERIDALVDTIAALERRGESAPTVRAELANELHATLDARLSELVGRVDGSETQLRERLNTLAASYESLVAFQGDSEKLRRKLDRLADAVSTLEQRSPDVDAAHAALVADLHATLDARLAEVHGRIDAGLPADDALRHRVDALAQGVDSVPGRLHGELQAALDARLGELRAELDSERAARDHRDNEQAAAEGIVRERLEAVASDVAGTAHTLDAMRHELEGRLAEGFDTVVRRLDAVEMRVTGVEGAAHDHSTLDTPTRGDLAALETALEARLGSMRHAIETTGSGALRASVEALEQRVDSQTAAIEEQSRATERAVRKGLAAIGERLASTESAYTEAGDALRRSVERLGWVIDDADRAIAVPVPDTTSTGYVVFAPTADGYRLLAGEGHSPELGEVLELDGVDGPVTVERIGLSPLPFDRRPCLYVERWRPPVAAFDA